MVTNKTPTGLNRGFGGPQVYFALERLVQRIAVELGLDPLDVIRRNLVPADAFPYRTASGALLDSGDYQEAIRRGVDEGALAELKSRRDAARAEGRLYGIGYTAVVEPSVSNMGYITTVLTPAERRKAGPKNGAQATATIAIDPVGSVTVHVASVPQGQGHRTVLSQVVADVFGLTPGDIRVNTEIDTAKDAWSIASGNYASRFAPAVAGTAKLAATRIAARLARIAASQLNTDVDDIAFVGGHVGSKRNPDNKVSFSRVAGLSHWSPAALPDGVGQTIRETVFWSPPELTAPDEDRSRQLVALPRLHLRFLRRRDRSHHAANPDRPLRHHARLRHHPASGHGRRPDPRRLRPGRRRRALRGIRLWRRRQLPDRDLRRLSAADHDGSRRIR